MRKLFAGIAAAATLFGGMALGAAGAQAADVAAAPLLQVNNAQEGHTYTPYKFATFANAGNGSVEVNTVAAWKDAVKTAADAAERPGGIRQQPGRVRGDLQRGAAPQVRRGTGQDQSAAFCC